jgi:DNA-binding MarR family transcriptional regulator
MTPTPPAPDRRLYFLLNRASHSLSRMVDRRCLAELGCTSSQLAALWTVVRVETCLQKDLAAALNQQPSAITGLVGRMEDGGLVERRRVADDARATRLAITPRGRRTLERARPLLDELNATIATGFTAAELEVVARFLRAVIARASPGTAAEAEASEES